MDRAHDPKDMLVGEHRLIERVVADIREKAEEIDGGERITVHYAITVADFFLSYTDACHHGKEEDILFARLRTRDLDPAFAKAMDGLVREHEWARNTTIKLGEAGDRYAHGDEAALGEIAKDMRALAQFYPRHIEKEEGSFFDESRSYFSDDEWAAMSEEFRAFDADLVHEKYEKVVAGLESGAPREVGVPS